MALSDNQKFIHRGWYEARGADGSSTVVYITSPEGYATATRTFRVRPYWAGANLDTIRVYNNDRLHIIAPDDWVHNKRKYGIKNRFPDATEGGSYLRRSKGYKSWKEQRRTRPPGSGSHYGMARSSMAQHMYPYQGNIHYDMNTQRQFNIPGHLGGIGMMPNPYRR